MINNPLFKKLEQFALANSYSVEQIQDVSRKQIETAIGESLADCTCINGMKRAVAQALQRRDDELDLQVIRDKIIAYYPNAEFDKRRVEGKRTVTVWLDGKPERIENGI